MPFPCAHTSYRIAVGGVRGSCREAEQDKPDVTPLPTPRGRRAAAATPAATPIPTIEPPRPSTFAFAFDVRMALAALPFGVTPFTTGLGPWSLRTPPDNVEGAEVTGPYAWFKVAGPAHISFKDGGLTFATTANRGVCIRFKRPVAGLVPKGIVKHPALTVTVDRPDDLVAALTPVASSHGQA